MPQLLDSIFSGGWTPQGYGLGWQPSLAWLHIVSDALIALAYAAIVVITYRVIRERGTLPVPGPPVLWVAFVVSGAAMHLFRIWAVWRPDYGVEGLIKAATAGIWLAAAFLIVRMAPRLQRLPSRTDLEQRLAEQSERLSASDAYRSEQAAERDQARQALAERESRLRSIVDTAVNAILTIDEKGTVESFNPAATRLFGYAESEVIGRNVSMLMSSPEREAHDQYLRNYCETGRKKIIGIGREVVGKRKDGALIPLDLAVSEFETARGRRFTGILSDISARKEAERRLAESMEAVEETNRALQHRNEELDDFAHTVSHDLKEPLRGIQMYCWTLVEDFGERMPEEARATLGRIQALAKRMHNMVHSVLEYSRLGRETRIRRADLNEIVQEAVDTLHATIKERGCDLRIPRPFPEAECDPVATTESLKNLISNASKYNDKPEKWIEVGWDQAAGEPLTLYVRDNGIGINERQSHEIFRIFHRLHRDGSYGEGAGAGLAIVKKLVERQGGRIWVESQPNQGSTFRFTLAAPPSDDS